MEKRSQTLTRLRVLKRLDSLSNVKIRDPIQWYSDTRMSVGISSVHVPVTVSKWYRNALVRLQTVVLAILFRASFSIKIERVLKIFFIIFNFKLGTKTYCFYKRMYTGIYIYVCLSTIDFSGRNPIFVHSLHEPRFRVGNWKVHFNSLNSHEVFELTIPKNVTESCCVLNVVLRFELVETTRILDMFTRSRGNCSFIF